MSRSGTPTPAKLAIVATHPIQYQVPWFRALHETDGIDLTVYYAFVPDAEQQGVGFGRKFAWDIPMFEGYRWEVLPNAAPSPSLRGFRNSSTPSVKEKLASTRPDAVIITGWHALPLAQTYLAAVRLGIPRIVRGESNALRSRRRWVTFAQRLYLSRFQAFMAIGKSNRDFYLERGVRPDEIVDAPYFVDNQRFRTQWLAARTSRAELRRAWNIPETATCFVYAGKFEPKKRVMDLLRALDAARREADVYVLAVGTGELMDEARAFANERTLPVTFAGFLNQTTITDAYAAADCLVLPSDFGETWGLVVNEGMCCELPAIVSDRVGCGPDLVTPRQTGAIFPFGNVERLAGEMIEFARGKEAVARMGAAAWQRVQSYSVERAVAGTLAAVERAIRPKQSRARLTAT